MHARGHDIILMTQERINEITLILTLRGGITVIVSVDRILSSAWWVTYQMFDISTGADYSKWAGDDIEGLHVIENMRAHRGIHACFTICAGTAVIPPIAEALIR